MMKKINSPLKLQSVASMAQELIRGIEKTYGRPVECVNKAGIGTGFPELDNKIGGLRKGELLVVAVPNEKLREVFCLGVVQHVALQLSQAVAFYCMQESFSLFFRRLLNVAADISPEINIYDGKLSAAELLRLSTVLVELNNATIHANPTDVISLEEICGLAKSHYKKTGGRGLILVDYIQCITDSHHCQINPHAAIARLKKLARELMLPIIVLHKLYPLPVKDSAAKNSEQEVARRNKLREQIPVCLRPRKESMGEPDVFRVAGYVEQVTLEADTVIYMSGTPEKPNFAKTEALKANSVGCPDWIRRFKIACGSARGIRQAGLKKTGCLNGIHPPQRQC